ncbi:hypothetical protein KCP70_03335 [Salmonella enterica subsp. enterica]|nr:hypothetical protein KCP70_03335 [Salmonella enterica subsp. enterica]
MKFSYAGVSCSIASAGLFNLPVHQFAPHHAGDNYCLLRLSSLTLRNQLRHVHAVSPG